MKIITGLAGQQGTQEWLNWRKNHLTASEMPIVMGVSPWSTPEKLFYEKLGLGEAQFESHNMARGKRLEPIARHKLNELKSTNFVPIVIESMSFPFLGASLDGFCNNVICEIKTGNEEEKKKAQAGIIPEHYRIQIETQLLVSNLEMCYYAFYDDADDDLTVIEVRQDLDLQVKIIEAANEFWERLQNLDPPETKYEEKQDEEWIKWSATLSSAQAGIKILEVQEKEAKEKLIELSQGKCCKGYGYGVVHSVRQGSVDYKKVVEDYHVDETKYRKEPTQVVTVRKMK